jgi:hypothetical protein
MNTQRLAALGVLALGILLVTKLLTTTWVLLLVAAALAALAAGSGWIGRWGYAVAAVCVLLAVPTMAFGFLRSSVNIALRMFKMAPFLLVILGLYMLYKTAKR